MTRRRRVLCYFVLLVAAGFGARAQERIKEQFAHAQKENAAQLRQYAWTSRTEIKLKGESKNVKIESVRYDATGQLQKTTVSSSPQKQPQGGGRLKQKVVEKKTEDFAELLGGLGKLAQSYAHLTPEQSQAFAQSARTSKGEGAMQGTVQLEGGNVVVQGDTVTLWIDASTFLIRQVSIQSRYDGNPVTLTVTYQVLPGGPSYPARTELSYPKKEVQLLVGNSNYQRLQAAQPPATRVQQQIPKTAPATPSVTDAPWPRRIARDGTTLIAYPPQVDEWKEFSTLVARMAFSLEPKGGQAVVGAFSIQANTDVDNESHIVILRDLKVVHTNFPSLDPDRAASMDQLLRSFVPSTVTVSLERIVACTPKKQSAPTVQLKNDPPHIFVSYKPAILLDVDGEPVSVPIPNTTLEYVMNTSWRLIRDKSDSQYYFLAGEQWLTARDLNGPWSAATKLPRDMETAAKDEHFADLKNFVPLRQAGSNAIVPVVFYSNGPAEVVLFDGQPEYTPITGTDLSYATNTVSYIFSHARTKQVYYLTAGRWFSAASLEGPWTFATFSLPDDFTRIPRSSPASQVLSSVPGTEEAKDSVLMAQIPTTAAVDAKAAAAAAKATYDGKPQFAPIEGTSMQYGTNTAQKVIKVKEMYYLCLQGVWFVGPSPEGPWETASSVPQEIYTIPPNSPVYNVTYVTQTTTSSGGIEASYTAGYMGAFIVGATTGAVIAGGTGYYYPPYIGYYPGYYGYPPYYVHPYTYGSVGYYNSATGRYGVSQTAYGPYGSATRSASYNPYTGTAARSASISTPYGRASAGQAYNPYTGAYGATVQGSNAYAQWGSSVVSKGGESASSQHYSSARGTAASVQTSSGGSAAGINTARGTTAAGKTESGDMYVGHDGNVYKNSGNGWQKYDNGNWNPVSGSTGTAAQQNAAQQRRQSSQAQGSLPSGGAPLQNLQSEATNRERGMQTSQRFEQRSAGGRTMGAGRPAGEGRRR